jgi:hypothetical protein
MDAALDIWDEERRAVTEHGVYHYLLPCKGRVTPKVNGEKDMQAAVDLQIYVNGTIGAEMVEAEDAVAAVSDALSSTVKLTNMLGAFNYAVACPV